MERRKLGRTGLEVGVVGLGTWRTFDVQEAAKELARAKIVTAALDAGANLFDTARMYGEAERVLGQALVGRRERAIVATKVWAYSLDEGKAQIIRALNCFQGHVEVYQIHNLVRWEMFLPLLEDLKIQGQIGAIGITAYATSAYHEMKKIIESGRVDVVQIPYNVMDRAAINEMLPLAREMNIGVIVMRPFAEGDLAQREPPRAKLNELHLERFGVETWTQILLKWILSDPRVHAAIPATSSIAHMQQNAAAGNPPWFDADTRDAIVRLVSHSN